MFLYYYSNLQVNNIDIFHSIKVAKLCNKLCNLLNINEGSKEIILISAILHDMGKIKIDPYLLNKKGTLSSREWDEIKKHSVHGYVLAKNMEYNSDICKNILYHHENCDGTGYPEGIKGNRIPLGAAIIRLCDSYDAIRSERPYKKAINHKEAVTELMNNGNMYRKDLLNNFLKLDFNVTEEFYNK